jgi:hypothetical protein
MLNIISQNQAIFLLPFKTILIMVSKSFFPHMNVKQFRVKNSFDPVLNFGFNLGH